MRNIKIISVMALLAIAGCASSPQGMRTDPEALRTFYTDLPYQQALKRVVEYHQACDYIPLIPLGQVINDVSHYPDLRSANIVRGAQGIGRQITRVIDIAEVEGGRTKVEVWSKARADSWGQHYEKVVNGTLKCES